MRFRQMVKIMSLGCYERLSNFFHDWLFILFIVCILCILCIARIVLSVEQVSIDVDESFGELCQQVADGVALRRQLLFYNFEAERETSQVSLLLGFCCTLFGLQGANIVVSQRANITLLFRRVKWRAFFNQILLLCDLGSSLL